MCSGTWRLGHGDFRWRCVVSGDGGNAVDETTSVMSLAGRVATEKRSEGCYLERRKRVTLPKKCYLFLVVSRKRNISPSLLSFSFLEFSASAFFSTVVASPFSFLEFPESFFSLYAEGKIWGIFCGRKNTDVLNFLAPNPLYEWCLHWTFQPIQNQGPHGRRRVGDTRYFLFLLDSFFKIN